jgi:hypothetical protein
MTKEQEQEYVAALVRELEGYKRDPRFQDRIADVEAELERVGFKAKPPAKRATKMKKDRTEL